MQLQKKKIKKKQNFFWVSDCSRAEGGHPASFEQSEKLVSKRSACDRRLERSDAKRRKARPPLARGGNLHKTNM